MTDNEHEGVPLIEGDTPPPDFTPNPVEGEDPGTEDPDMPDPEGLPAESFEADESDDKGREAGV